MVISQQLYLISNQSGTKPAISYLEKETNFKDLFHTIGRLSYLYQNELGQKVRMAYLARNCPAWITTFFALSNTRSINIPMDPDASPEEIGYWLRETKATHIAVSNDMIRAAREILKAERLSLPIIEIEKKYGGEYDNTFTSTPDMAPHESDVMLILRTAGTSGKPKFVTFTHKQILNSVRSLRNKYQLNQNNDRISTSMSWSHPFAFLHGCVFPLLMGTCVVVDHGMLAGEHIDFLVNSKTTRLIGTPSYFYKFLLTIKNVKKTVPLLKTITVSTGTLSPELGKAFNMMKVSVAHCYGQTENLWTIAMQDTLSPEVPDRGMNRGFAGKGLAGIRYRVVDGNGDEIAGRQKRVGQLAISGNTIMSGYFEKEKETKQAIRGTWLYTGDIVRLDGEADSLTVTWLGRKEDMVIPAKGEPISLFDIDAVLKKNPAVQDAATFWLKNAQDQDVLACVIVKRHGHSFTESQVKEHANSLLAKKLVPETVLFADNIPRDLGSNVNYAKLRYQYAGAAG